MTAQICRKQEAKVFTLILYATVFLFSSMHKPSNAPGGPKHHSWIKLETKNAGITPTQKEPKKAGITPTPTEKEHSGLTKIF